MKKLAYLAASLAFVPTLVSVSPVFAASPGQLSDSDNNYLVKNVTKNTANGKTASATCNETVKYTIELANAEFGLISNIVVSANLQNGNMTASGTNSANTTTSTSGSVNVTVDKGTLVYVPGSTVLTPVDSSTRQLGTPVAKADGITAGGLNVGNLNGSTREYVQFQAKVVCEPVVVPKDIQVCELATKTIKTIKENEFDAAKYSKNLNDCKTVVVPGKIQVCELATKKVISINENDFDAAKHSKDLNKCAEVAGVTTPTPTTPAVIASTGPASTALTMLGLGSLAAAATYYVRSRRTNILG